jgi:hypothetical protein
LRFSNLANSQINSGHIFLIAEDIKKIVGFRDKSYLVHALFLIPNMRERAKFGLELCSCHHAELMSQAFPA